MSRSPVGRVSHRTRSPPPPHRRCSSRYQNPPRRRSRHRSRSTTRNPSIKMRHNYRTTTTTNPIPRRRRTATLHRHHRHDRPPPLGTPSGPCNASGASPPPPRSPPRLVAAALVAEEREISRLRALVRRGRPLACDTHRLCCRDDRGEDEWPPVGRRCAWGRGRGGMKSEGGRIVRKALSRRAHGVVRMSAEDVGDAWHGHCRLHEAHAEVRGEHIVRLSVRGRVCAFAGLRVS